MRPYGTKGVGLGKQFLEEFVAIFGHPSCIRPFIETSDAQWFQPQLLDWLAKRPLRALELSDEWSRLLEIVAWLQAFPQVKDSLVIFGAGYGFEMLSKAEWLSRRRVHYWNDIDTHGFAILDQLRSRFDHVESFLMDRTTLLAFASQWGGEEKQTLRDLPRLRSADRAQKTPISPVETLRVACFRND